MDPVLLAAADAVLVACRRRNLTLATAESCTGGLIAAALTAIAGSSDVVDRGFVTYSNAAKVSMLGVPAEMIETEGAVSEPVAACMSIGAVLHSLAGIAVSVTGVAGPGGGSANKPVGTVCFGVTLRGGVTTNHRHWFPGDRDAVRDAAATHALALVRAALDGTAPV